VIRVGIIGAGGMGNVHARQYLKRSDVDLRFYDRNPERSRNFAEMFQAKQCATYEELIREVDVIDVCLPTKSHCEFAMMGLKSGRAVLVEKPITFSLEDAIALNEEAERQKVVLMPAHVVRFFPEYRNAHDLIVKGDIGLPAVARLRRGGSFPVGSDSWFQDLSKSGGVLLDLCIHDFDWIRWTLGEVKFLYSRSVAQKTGAGPDHAMTTLTLENGCVAHVEGTWMDPTGFRTYFDIAGSDGLLQHDSRANAAVRTSLAAHENSGAPLPILENGIFDGEDPYALEIDGFLHAVTAGVPPPVPALDGLMALSISLAAIESARTDQTVSPSRHF
jgi:predicted dehydrogenase